MNVIELKSYEEMSIKACDIMIQCLQNKPDALFCIATGSSPTLTYQLFVKRIKEEHIDTSQMRVLKLDEWCGLSQDNPATCEYYVRKYILTPLNIPDERYIGFDSMASDSEYECERISKLLKEHKGIDCCILGIGKNGHLGLNEPREAINPFIHKIDLDAQTKTHSMLASNGQEVSQGYTLGLKDILNAKQILLLITGPGKETAYQDLHKKVISSKYPANYLWLHDQATCIVDKSSF